MAEYEDKSMMMSDEEKEEKLGLRHREELWPHMPKDMPMPTRMMVMPKAMKGTKAGKGGGKHK